MMTTIREYVAKTRPQMSFVSHFYTNAWLAGIVFAEIAERCIKTGRPLKLPYMKAALESTATPSSSATRRSSSPTASCAT